MFIRTFVIMLPITTATEILRGWSAGLVWVFFQLTS